VVAIVGALALGLVLVLLIILVARGGGAIDLGPVLARLEALERGLERLDRSQREDQAAGREEAARAARDLRTEVAGGLKATGDSLEQKLEAMRGVTEQKLEGVKVAVDQRLQRIQETSELRLEAMRQTVDEKLQGTLEARIGESFRQVSERLEQVHKGLGEMQVLATGVGDLKRVLTNVKTRGTWGEYQLGNLLEQVLTPSQYAQNVPTRQGSQERVEFAIRLPGRDEGGAGVWLPIDAKFPQEDYQRLVEAADAADGPGVVASGAALEARVKGCARDISTKYLDPPRTTDFGLLFLPTEGLYAEIARRPGLLDTIQREHRVVVAGPTTLLALLNSLQMGFRTLAIEQRSSEVWQVLGAFKAEFATFSEALDKARERVRLAGDILGEEGMLRRTRAIERKLRDVQELPAAQAATVLEE